MTKCDFCSESSPNPNEQCPVYNDMTRSTACKEAAERFYELPETPVTSVIG